MPGAPAAPVHAQPPGPDEAGGVLAAYRLRAEELFARIEDCLARGADSGIVAAQVEELAEDLASVMPDDRLVKVLQRLVAALRSSGNPRAELAAARKSFAETDMAAPGFDGGRRNWWRRP